MSCYCCVLSYYCVLGCYNLQLISLVSVLCQLLRVHRAMFCVAYFKCIVKCYFKFTLILFQLAWVGKYIMRNAECGISTTYNLRNIVCGKTCWILYTLHSETKVVVCYLLNKRVATFSIVTYCQQIGEDSALVIPQNIRGRIPHSVFRIPQSILTLHELLLSVGYVAYYLRLL